MSHRLRVLCIILGVKLLLNIHVMVGQGIGNVIHPQRLDGLREPERDNLGGMGNVA